MAVAAPFADRMAQTKSRHIDDAEAQRISNKIDEELKVRVLDDAPPSNETLTMCGKLAIYFGRNLWDFWIA